jgi:hypothetical protein
MGVSSDLNTGNLGGKTMREFLIVGFVVAAAIPVWLFGRRLRTEKGEATAEPAEPSARAIIVPSTLSPAYYFFLQAFAKEHSLKVIVDRRGSERRREPRPIFAELRCHDRRGTRPATWHDGDFILAGVPSLAAAHDRATRQTPKRGAEVMPARG